MNGKLLLDEGKAISGYRYVKVDVDKAKLFKKGKNTIAVFCHNAGGKQYIDLGIGKTREIKADVTFTLNTVNQQMAYDKKILYATAGQTVKIILNNKDQMPHNLVVLQEGSLEVFGKVVDEFLKAPEAAKMAYIPNSRYVLSATKMLDPGVTEAIVFQLPDTPGRYPFVCTFPGHWRLMQGVIIVNAPGTYLSKDEDATRISMLGGGSSHDFLKFFGTADAKLLSENGENSVTYTESSSQIGAWIKNTDILYLCNNRTIDLNTRAAIMARINEGKMNLLVYHPSAWYNWLDWPVYNKQLLGGGSRSHEELQEFEVRVVKPEHPIMKGVPSRFRVVDELYRWEKDPEGTAIEVLAVGRGLKSGEEFPVVWVVKHPKAKIVGNTLGHDERAHDLKAYQSLLKNSVRWLKK